MKTIRTLVLMTLLAMSARGDDWPQLGGNPSRTRLPGESVGAALMLGSQATGSATFSSPVASDGFLVTARLVAKVRAFRESDRTPLWNVSTGTSFVSTPLVERGRIFLPALDGELRILRLADGASLGTIATGGSGYSSPVLAGNTLFLTSGFPGTALLALDIDLKTILWTASLDQVSYVSPAVASGTVVVGTNKGTVSAFDAATGQLLWSVDVGGSFGATAPVILGTSVYCMSEGTLTQFQLATGSIVGTPLTLVDDAVPALAISTQFACSPPALIDGKLMGVVRFDYAIDSNVDGYVDSWTLREFVYAADPNAMALVGWRQLLIGQALNVDLNAIPPYTLAPSPISTAAGAAVASSLDPTLRLVSATGSISSLALDAPSMASPMVANARIYALSKSGKLHTFEDAAPQPAAALGLTPNSSELTSEPPTLTWTGSGASYLVRMARDGEFLMNWDFEDVVTSTSIPCPTLTAGALHTWGVRVRSASGAWSPWSTATLGVGLVPDPPAGLAATPYHQRVALTWTPSPTPGVSGYRLSYGATTVDLGPVTSTTVTGLTNGTPYTFTLRALGPAALGSVPSSPVSVSATPASAISIGGTFYDSLAAALLAAGSGDVVHLGAETFEIGATLHVPSGVTLEGVNARDSRLVASSPIAMVDLQQGSALRNLSLSGGQTGVVVAAAQVTIANCVIRDMSDAGVAVTGQALVINNTLVGNANAGIRASGHVDARNNIVQSNGVGLVGMISSTYNDVSDGYSIVTPGTGDRHSAVQFIDPASGDYREQAHQPSLDAGAPSDAFNLEPAPNGDRINMGAFGNTPLAATTTAGGPAPPGACGLTGLEVLILLALLRRRR